MINLELLLTLIFTFILMILDYILTIVGFNYYNKDYAKHFVVESYELNPMFRKNVMKRKYNYKHLLSAILILILITFFYYQGIYFRLIQGAIFSLLAYINIGHITNIISFKYLSKDKSAVKGKVNISLAHSLRSSIINTFGTLLLFLVIYIFVQDYFILGCIIGFFAFMVREIAWLNLAVKKSKKNHIKKNTNKNKRKKVKK